MDHHGATANALESCGFRSVPSVPRGDAGAFKQRGARRGPGPRCNPSGRGDKRNAARGRGACRRAWSEAGAKDDTPPEAREDLSIGKPVVYTQAPVINALAFFPDGKSLAVSGNREVLIHSIEGTTAPKRLPGLSDRILALAFSKDGSTLVAAGGTPARRRPDRAAALWETLAIGAGH